MFIRRTFKARSTARQSFQVMAMTRKVRKTVLARSVCGGVGLGKGGLHQIFFVRLRGGVRVYVLVCVCLSYLCRRWLLLW